MNVALWIAQAILAVALLADGIPKLRFGRGAHPAHSPAETSSGENLSPGTSRAIGVVEILIAAGLVLPRLLGVAPVVTAICSLVMVCLMIPAAIRHWRRNKGQLILVDLGLILLALFVLWGRGVEVLLGNDAGA